MTTSAVSVLGEKTRGTRGSGMTRRGVAWPAIGRNRPTYSASAMELAAMAPEKPATKEVHPLRNPMSGP